MHPNSTSSEMDPKNIYSLSDLTKHEVKYERGQSKVERENILN